MSIQPSPPESKNKKMSRPRGYFIRLIVFGILSLILLLHAGIAFLLIRPARAPVCCIVPSDWGAVYEDVSLAGADGIRLAGWYIPSRNHAALILLHGYNSSRQTAVYQAEVLSRNGFGVLMYDERACGESGGSVLSWGWRDLDDVPAAIQFIQARPEVDPQRIGIMGMSTGGEIALGAAAQNPELRAVIADGAGFAVVADIPPVTWEEKLLILPSDWLLFQFVALESWTRQPEGLTTAIPKISPRPVFLISTGSDHEMRQAERYYSVAGEPKQVWNIPEAQHGGGIHSRPLEYEQRIVDFLLTSLLAEKE
jgi:pimeloyl-ACP methyl ester carboxylesterase